MSRFPLNILYKRIDDEIESLVKIQYLFVDYSGLFEKLSDKTQIIYNRNKKVYIICKTKKDFEIVMEELKKQSKEYTMLDKHNISIKHKDGVVIRISSNL